MGPLVAERRLHAMDTFVSDAIAKGAKIQTGGQRNGNKGYFYEPTVMTDVPLDAKIMNEEPFGPLAPISPFKDFDDVMKEANRLPWGLAAYAYTKIDQDRGGDRCRLRERHGVDQPPRPRPAGSAVRRREGLRATARKAASRRSRPTSTPSSSASWACDGRRSRLSSESRSVAAARDGLIARRAINPPWPRTPL